MMYTGCDIIEVNRIKESLLNEGFKSKVYTEREIAYCEKSNGDLRYEHYAARFAAKEALFKALSGVIKKEFFISYKNIEVLDDGNGRPYVNLIGISNPILSDISIDVSLSHTKDYAIATAIVTTNT